MGTGNSDPLLVSLPRRYGLLALVWSVLAGGSLLWNLHEERQDVLDLATATAHTNIQRDFNIRKWVNSHGGVYVGPTGHTPPNPYLDVSERDVITTTGRKLTLMNHAYVLREIQTDFTGDDGVNSHIASLHPLNPANAADEWETRALRDFEQGSKKFLEMQQINGQPYLRMMEPFMVEQECVGCHTGQKAGEVRGGISSSIPLDRFIAHRHEHSNNLWLSHGMIWLFGMAALGVAYQRDFRLLAERRKAQQDLHQQLDELLRFQKLTVGRELRMKELSEENATLREQLAIGPPEGTPP